MSKCFQAILSQLHNMLAFVRNESEKAGFPESIVLKIELAAEEVLTNIINYGYPQAQGVIEIQCHVKHNHGIQIVIKDQGVDFNPLKHTTSFNPKDPVKTSIGGCGIFFIQQLMDEVHYERAEESNILTLVKYHN